MEHFEFLFDTDTTIFIVFVFGLIIGFLITVFINAMDAIFRLIEEIRLNKKIVKLEKLKNEVKENEKV